MTAGEAASGSVCLAVTCHDPAGAFADGIRTVGGSMATVFDATAINATAETAPSTIAALASALPSARRREHGAGTVGIGAARRDALALALEAGTTHVAYSDLDHVLRWAERDLHELGRAMTPEPDVDLTVIGRSPRAFLGEPERLRETEGAVNRAAALILGPTAGEVVWDLMIATRLMTREAARLIVDESTEDSIGNDVDWPLMAACRGLRLSFVGVDGLAYRFRDDFGSAADTRDDDPAEWVRRLEIAALHATAMRPYL